MEIKRLNYIIRLISLEEAKEIFNKNKSKNVQSRWMEYKGQQLAIIHLNKNRYFDLCYLQKGDVSDFTNTFWNYLESKIIK